MNKLRKRANQTNEVYVKPAERPEVCSLESSIDVTIDGKLFCLAHICQSKHKDALRLCQSLNATLPLPKSIKEHKHLVESFKRLGLDKKMNDLSTKIVLDVRRLPNKGRFSLFLVKICYPVIQGLYREYSTLQHLFLFY